MKDKIKDVAKGIFNFPQVDSETTAWFIFEGKEYEMAQFNISFGQAVDHKGQPQDQVRGGRMSISLTQALPNNIYNWAMSSNTKNGEIVFRSKTTNAPLRVAFMNAYCVNFERHVDSLVGLNTELIISPDEIQINGISFDNHWVE